ncbi:DUF3466 family protein [Enterovibrio sp. 27052020O]|uniref:DUF3466 family protein n=1 Tax=Enterovibrio sp. 27052020O TaxID=3241166 RepID=UPI0038900E10
MQFNKFKLSAVALAMAGFPIVANAALYSVSKIDTPSESNSAAATAISPNGDKIAVEVLSGPVGLNYSQELPYMVDVEHFINSYNDLDSYCFNYLGYNTCDTWANEQWYGIKASGEVCDSEDYDANICTGGLNKEIDAWTQGFTGNSVASVGGEVNPFSSGVTGPKPSGSPNPNSTNVVVNAVTDTGKAIGASSSPYYDAGSYNARAFARRGFNEATELLPPSGLGSVIESIGQTNANGVIDYSGTAIVFGSASTHNMANPGNKEAPEDSGLSNLNSCSSTVDFSNRACQYYQFANQASVWIPSYDANARVIADFPNGATGNTDDTAQASVKAASVLSGATAPTMVGFSTYNDSGFYARAVKYTPIADFSTCLTQLETDTTKRCWTMSLIPGIEIRQGGDIVYSYSEANDINANNVVVGVAKNYRLNSGAYAEIVFVNEGASTTLLSTSQSALFFSGYNATAAAINDNNELVGAVDVESSRDRARRQRGYVYLHGTAPNLADFDNTRGWLLDDLTNGAPGANAFRIAEAFDIAENGNIAASAFYCAGGYSSTAHDATCNGEEELVAVKLTRQSGDISPRPYETNTITRSGGGFGVLGLALLGFGGLLRRRK